MDEQTLVTILNKMGIEFGSGVMALLPIIPLIVARLKDFPVLKKLQDKGYPAYEGSAVGLGILGAWAFGIANPVVAGIVLGLAGIGGRQIVKRKETNNVTIPTTGIH